jgi:multimeric flavodoxin WrbA
MPTVAVVYHSGFGHTKVVAEAVIRGAASVAGTQAKLISVDELPTPDADRKLGGRWDELNAADAIVFGCPTYMGSVSAAFKKFMEDSSGIWFAQSWKDKIAAGFTNSGGPSGDKLNALIDIAVFAGQHSMIWVNQGIMPSSVTGDGQNLNRLGGWLGGLSQSDNAPPDVTPPVEDRKTHERFGKRIAEATQRWVAAQ